MGMETRAATISTGVQNVQRPRENSGSTEVSRRGGTTGTAFAPRTNVSIQNSVSDMAGILSKISENQQESADSLSPTLRALIDNIMKQSFSLESTLASGLGSTLESQRFSVDQLMILSRLLSQLGTLSERGENGVLSEGVESFLSNLKQFMTAKVSRNLEPALLHKLAFEMLDAKSMDDLPQELQFLLQGMTQAVLPQQQATSGSMVFLKQLIQYFMPQADPAESTEPQGKASADTPTAETQSQTSQASDGTQQQTVRGEASRMASEGQLPAEAAGKSGESSAFAAATTQRGEVQQTASNTQPAQTTATPQPKEETATPAMQGQTMNSSQPGDAQGPLQQGKGGTPAHTEGQEGAKQTQGNQASQTANAGRPAQSDMTTPSKTQSPILQMNNAQMQAHLRGLLQPQTSQQASATAPQKPPQTEVLQNTPQTMATMKQLGTLLLKNAEITTQDAKLLQSFVNGENRALSEQDAKQLRLLLRLCQANVPASVAQAAQHRNAGNLPRLWAFMQLCDLAYLKEKNHATSLKKAGKEVAEFASMVRGQMRSDSAQRTDGARTMSFMVPLYMGDAEKTAYPTYIHIYDEEKEDPAHKGKKKKETWLRLCLMTENIGAVDLTFRMYDKNLLDVHVLFSNRETAAEFKNYVEEFRATFVDSVLTLQDLTIATAGETDA